MSIKLLVMDVDGTLTDGKIYIGKDGEMMKAFNVRDGYAIVNILPKYGIMPVIITGRESEIVSTRAKELLISELHQRIYDKKSKLYEIMEKYGVDAQSVAYIGDDVNDIECMEFCRLSACPSNGDENVKKVSSYVCKNKGGDGAVREFIEYIISQNEK